MTIADCNCGLTRYIFVVTCNKHIQVQYVFLRGFENLLNLITRKAEGLHINGL